MNTGAEANETCIKIARKWAYTVKGVPRDQAEIIVCNDNFHGRTTTIVGFSSEEKYKENFGPYGGGFKLIPFGDIEALKAAITPHTAAFLCEPIQAEGGIIIPPDGWMAQVRQVCDENNVLLIWDEVQTGFCRTGRRMAFMHEDAQPDLLAVGKPLGGGALPVSAAVGGTSGAPVTAAARYTISCVSVRHRPCALLKACSTSTNSRSPVRPALCLTEAMRECFCAASPTRSGLLCHCRRPPAHMRRGSGTGGKKPPRKGWPSGPIWPCGACGKKYSQCHSGGTSLPAAWRSSSRLSKALWPRSGAATISSVSVSLRPSQPRR